MSFLWFRLPSVRQRDAQHPRQLVQDLAVRYRPTALVILHHLELLVNSLNDMSLTHLSQGVAALT